MHIINDHELREFIAISQRVTCWSEFLHRFSSWRLERSAAETVMQWALQSPNTKRYTDTTKI